MGFFDLFKGTSRSVEPSTPKTTHRVRSHSARSSAYYGATDRPIFGDLNASRGSADYELANALDEIRARVRSLSRNNGMMRRYIWLLRVNILGDTGFRLQSRVKMQDGQLDVSLNRRVEDAWAEFCESPTVDGEMDMLDLTNLAVSSWAQDGEVIWEIVYGKQYPFGFVIDPVEPDLLDHTLNTVYEATGNDIRLGVEVDSRKRPVAYHFLTAHPGDLTWSSNTNRKRYRRVPADQIIRLYDRERVGQSRGIPSVVSSVTSLHLLDAYREAETVFRRLKAAMGGFFKKAVGSTVDAAIDEMADGTGTDEFGDEVYETYMEPGLFRQIPDGLEPVPVDVGGTVTDYASFEKQEKKDIANGMNLSVFAVGQETEGVSYSTGRSVLIEDRDFYRTMQSFFIRGLMRKTFRLFARYAILNQDYGIPPTRLAAILRSFKFRPRGWDWIDPQKDITANALALKTGQTSLTRIAAQRGLSLDELLDEIEEDHIGAKERLLTLDYKDGIVMSRTVSTSGAKNA